MLSCRQFLGSSNLQRYLCTKTFAGILLFMCPNYTNNLMGTPALYSILSHRMSCDGHKYLPYKMHCKQLPNCIA